MYASSLLAGPLCGNCTANYSVTLDLRECTSRSCNEGLAVYLLSCKSHDPVCLYLLPPIFSLYSGGSGGDINSNTTV